MRSTSRLFSVAVAAAIASTLAAPVVARAQTCMGAPAFRVHPLRATASAFIADQVNGLGLGFAGGRTTADGRGSFAQAGVTRAQPENDPEAEAFGIRVDPAFTADATVGSQVPLSGRPGLSFCPTFAAGYTSGPELTFVDFFGGVGETEIDPTTIDVRLGAWLGGTLSESAGGSNGLRILPAVGLQLGYARTTVTVEGAPTPDPTDPFPIEPVFEDDEVTDTFGVVSLAAGFAFGDRWLVRPQLDFSVGVEGGGSTALRIALSLNFGGR